MDFMVVLDVQNFEQDTYNVRLIHDPQAKTATVTHSPRLTV